MIGKGPSGPGTFGTGSTEAATWGGESKKDQAEKARSIARGRKPGAVAPAKLSRTMGDE